VLLMGYPQDWIRTLGKRIAKLHFKDFSFKTDPAIRKRVPDFVPLLEGEVDWRAVHAAIADTGFQGTATVELPGGNGDYLKEVSRRFDRILNGV
jgi:hexulose-6-phosphate isomerase